jgi:hypothetical protein
MGSRKRGVSVIAVTLILGACGGADTVDEPTTTPPPTVAAAVTAPPSTASQDVPAPQLAGTNWNVTN